MGRVVKFPVKASPKISLKRAKAKKRPKPERHGQLNLFDQPESREARILQLKTNLNTFEEALMMDKQGDPKAADLYLKAIESGDFAADAWCNLGIMEFENEQKSKAINCFTNALKQDPRHFESHYNLANVYLEVENLELAKMHYEVAAEIEPDSPNVYYNLGVVYAMHKEFEMAVKSIERFIELTPGEGSSEAREFLLSLKSSLS